MIVGLLLLVGIASLNDEPATSAHPPRAQLSDWEIKFADDITLEEYARQLDFFKIEIASVAKDGTADYLSEVSQKKPHKRSGYARLDDRWHVAWMKGTLANVDRRLLTGAGIRVEGRELSHYFPKEIEAVLAKLELDHAGKARAEIGRTRFGIEKQDAGYRFVVIEQEGVGRSGKSTK